MDIDEHGRQCEVVLTELTDTVIADETVLRTVLTGTLARGHVLLEDVPGTGKTLTAGSLATILGLSFSRIQFTPDLLPSNITGNHVYNEEAGTFEFRKGPLFANVVLADEINRASPKTQSALLEAMEERQVTVDGETHDLPEPFFVIATQNPVEQAEGTFPLPEAQKDRFLVKTSLGYPDADDEFELLQRRESRTSSAPEADSRLSRRDVLEMQRVAEDVTVNDDLKRYIVEIARRTRQDNRVKVGVSPRGCQRLFEGLRAWAAVSGRDYVVPDDVRALAPGVLAHRLILTPNASIGDTERVDVVADVLDDVPVPGVGAAPTT